MPYVNIPPTGLPGAIATIVGKIQGNVSAKIVKQGLTITNKLNRKGCPTPAELTRMRNQKNQIDKAVKAMDGKLSKFASLPGKLKAPVSGLKAALKIILTLPIPQGIGIPPGPAGGLILGLPINITTKYADTMHLVKELIYQIEEIILCIDAVMQVPVGGTAVMKGNLSRADNALKACEVELALKQELEKGNIGIAELEAAGLIEENVEGEEPVMIFSTLGPKLLNQNSSKDLNGTSSDGLPNPNQKDKELTKGDIKDEITGRPVNDKKIDKDKLTDKDRLFTSGKADLSDSRFRGKWQEGVDYFDDDKVKLGKEIYVSTSDHTSTGASDDNGTCSLGPKYTSEQECNAAGGIWTKDSSVTTSGPPPTGPWKTPRQIELDALNALNGGLQGLENSNLPSSVKDTLRGLLNTLTVPGPAETSKDANFFYTGPNGDVYKLEIIKDPDSPLIAPRHFAVAKDYQDVIVLRGPKSFSSSVDVLLNEIKFRIDNQLP